jgi:integrase
MSLPQVPHKDPTFLEPEEVDRLAAAIAAPYSTFVLVGAYAGLRHGEVAALRSRRVKPDDLIWTSRSGSTLG